MKFEVGSRVRHRFAGSDLFGRVAKINPYTSGWDHIMVEWENDRRSDYTPSLAELSLELIDEPKDNTPLPLPD